MPVESALIANCDDALVFWRIARRIPECLGFEIERERKLNDGTIQRVTLENRKGFKKDDPKQGEHRPSTVWPFQRFIWTDHLADLGDTVRYRVTPMVMQSGVLYEQVSERSGWTNCRRASPRSYVKGVVSTLPSAAEEDESEVSVQVAGGESSIRLPIRWS